MLGHLDCYLVRCLQEKRSQLRCSDQQSIRSNFREFHAALGKSTFILQALCSEGPLIHSRGQLPFRGLPRQTDANCRLRAQGIMRSRRSSSRAYRPTPGFNGIQRLGFAERGAMPGSTMPSEPWATLDR